MMAGSRSWLRFTTFLVLNGLGLALLYGAAIAPVVDLLREQRGRIEAHALLLVQAASAAERNRLAASVQPADLEAAAARFVRGRTETLRQADLLVRLRSIGAESGVVLDSLRSLPAQPWAEGSLVGAQLEFKAGTEEAVAFLTAIEHGPSLLYIQRARISNAGNGHPSEPDTISASVEVFGVSQDPDS
jgi:hypothetical protein